MESSSTNDRFGHARFQSPRHDYHVIAYEEPHGYTAAPAYFFKVNCNILSPHRSLEASRGSLHKAHMDTDIGTVAEHGTTCRTAGHCMGLRLPLCLLKYGSNLGTPGSTGLQK